MLQRGGEGRGIDHAMAEAEEPPASSWDMSVPSLCCYPGQIGSRLSSLEAHAVPLQQVLTTYLTSGEFNGGDCDYLIDATSMEY